MSTTLRIERRYPYQRALVWRALTEPALLARWLMPNDFRPEVGHRFTFRTEPGPGFDGIVHCEVLEIVPLQRLVYTWVGGPIDTRISFTLSDCAIDGDGHNGGAGACRLVVEQSGFTGLRAWLVSRLLALGARKIYGQRLPQLLASLANGKTREGA